MKERFKLSMLKTLDIKVKNDIQERAIRHNVPISIVIEIMLENAYENMY